MYDKATFRKIFLPASGDVNDYVAHVYNTWGPGLKQKLVKLKFYGRESDEFPKVSLVTICGCG